ncbi:MULTISPECIES: LysR family transcriptional regulator [unclassified Acinetobacter]|uniref:LysR family transcriptional regulator n=1 Tax=unclassified Acinetobacter TaxID=196816 RepID=UPI002934A4FE|nr:MULTISPECIES: LysR family transcriptional regulator [unclassified Acinetobacter]WOE32605.1 LysR family transcriptional regulator [Acinetobacter sp. SAAs470]WOE38081.1 LysR family transcriptional regulator [Acinetobacter sp. SAAs474]
MELRHLRYFVCVVEEKSITRAAEKLCIAQPPLTRQIKSLEEELGVNLLERGSRPIKTTEVGEYFYQYAVQILTLTAHATSMVKRFKEVQSIVRIGYVGSLFYWKLPEIIHRYRTEINQSNQLNIELIECNTRDQIEALKTGKIDIGFSRLTISDPSIKHIILEKEKLLLAIHHHHPLSIYQHSGIYLSQIMSEMIFIYPNSPKPNFSTYIQNIFSELSLIPRHLIEVREIHMALGLVSSGEGVCIIPESARAIGMKNLSYIAIMDAEIYSPISLAYRTMDNNDYIVHMLNCIKQYLQLDLEHHPYSL